MRKKRRKEGEKIQLKNYRSNEQYETILYI